MGTINWVSSLNSVAQNKISVAAVAEVVVAVGAYWWAAWYFDTHIHLLMSLFIAPLLLLRSPESVKSGIESFVHFLTSESETNTYPLYTLRAGCVAVTTVFSFVLATTWLNGLMGWTLFFGSLAVGVSSFFIGIIAKEVIDSVFFPRGREAPVGLQVILLVATAYTIMFWFVKSGEGVESSVVSITGGLVSVGMIATLGNIIATAMLIVIIPSGTWIRTILIRLYATLCHPWKGLKNLPRNWWRSLFVIDFKHLPEMIPGLDDYTEGLSAKKFLHRFKFGTDFERAFSLVNLVVFFVPAYIYRLSIKSTCWFYLPLVYLVYLPTRDQASKYAFLEALRSSRLERLRCLLSIMTIVGLATTTYSATKGFKISQYPIITPLTYFCAIDLSALKPWNYFTLTSAIITGIIFFSCDRFLIHFKARRKQDSQAEINNTALNSLTGLTRLRDISTFTYLAIALLHVTLLLGDIERYMSPDLINWLIDFYGDWRITKTL